MKIHTPLFYTFFILSIWGLISCQRDQPSDPAGLSRLSGTWIRVSSPDGTRNGMSITVSGTTGLIAEDHFELPKGTIKWKDIDVSEDPDEFTFEDLYQLSSYIDGQMELDGDSLFVLTDGSAPEDRQKWVKLAAYTPPSSSSLTLPCQTINQPTEWLNTDAEIDYVIPPSCILNVDASLTIEKGTTIAMGRDAGIRIYNNGSLKILGEADEPVVIKGQEAGSGYWRGIEIETKDKGNKLEYVEISGAGREATACCSEPATITLFFGEAAITHVTLSNGAGRGIYVDPNSDFESFQDVKVESHKDYPLYIGINQVGQFDSVDSDFTGNSMDFVFVYLG